ncbi:MAG: DUF1080 domain-containing protein [Planctomycetes bacterium]|nr:DUF1080 domain-containing protein [Planctomycetota bacterium]
MKRLATIILLLLPLSVHAEGNRYAILVGINEYDHAKLPKLDYAMNDAAKMAELLKKHGYEVTLLTDKSGKEPTKKNIEAALEDVLGKYKKNDTIVLGYAGHGLQFGKDCYFCPRDAKPFPDETKTLVSLTEVYSKLEKAFDGVKLMLIDACRDDGGRGIRGGSNDAPLPPKGIGVLMSCSDGEKASESEELKHGVFFYHVIKGLEGEAKNKKNVVTWDSLRAYVKDEVPGAMSKLFKDQRRQNPNEVGNLSGTSPVLLNGWVSLFNGNDLTGWKMPDKPSDEVASVSKIVLDGKLVGYDGKLLDNTTIALWRIRNGMLVGTGARHHLFSDRDDYSNFHFLIEAKINDGGNLGNSGQFFRAKFGTNFLAGYEAQIYLGNAGPLTGSLFPARGTRLGEYRNEIVVNTPLHKRDEWFTQEVIAIDNHLIIKVNGKTTVDWKDPHRHFTKGHFALQVIGSATEVIFKRVEVLELK